MRNGPRANRGKSGAISKEELAVGNPDARLTQKIWVTSGARFAPSGRLGRQCGSYVAGRPRCRKSPLLIVCVFLSLSVTPDAHASGTAQRFCFGECGGARGGGARHPLATQISKKRLGLHRGKHRCFINCTKPETKTTCVNEKHNKLKDAFREITISA